VIGEDRLSSEGLASNSAIIYKANASMIVGIANELPKPGELGAILILDLMVTYLAG
jgi:hypothetical protein